MRRQTAIALFVVASFATLHLYLKVKHQPSFESNQATVGKPAAPFAGQTLDGKALDLAAVAKTNRLTVINFWESWCGPCKVEMPDLQKIYAKHHTGGLAMIGVYGNSSEASVRELVADLSVTFPMVHDPGSAIAKSYSVEAVPTTYVVGPDLEILRSTKGVDFGLSRFIEAELAKPGVAK
jgi:cytochrome c biogenesis protein CcmG, thiol:disulfide interchange protein DsbE